MYVNHIYSDRKRFFLEKRNEKLKLENRKFDIVQIGDSITEGFNISRYIYTNKSILNSGVGGDLSDTLLMRFEEDVVDYNPGQVILMIGINDIKTFFRKDNHNYMVANERLLLETVKNNTIKMINMCKDSQVLWCKILPISDYDLNCFMINEFIDKVNDEIASELSKISNVEIIDYNMLTTFDGRLDRNMSDDGTHPNDNGYMNMAYHLEQYIK